ncbi:MAG: hypothetical protein ABII18_12115 [bacterium]|nr:hypothetical protein [bacterium]MBU1916548.1 hypothetical protein [bacterium]
MTDAAKAKDLSFDPVELYAQYTFGGQGTNFKHPNTYLNVDGNRIDFYSNDYTSLTPINLDGGIRFHIPKTPIAIGLSGGFSYVHNSPQAASERVGDIYVESETTCDDLYSGACDSTYAASADAASTLDASRAQVRGLVTFAAGNKQVEGSVGVGGEGEIYSDQARVLTSREGGENLYGASHLRTGGHFLVQGGFAVTPYAVKETASGRFQIVAEAGAGVGSVSVVNDGVGQDILSLTGITNWHARGGFRVIGNPFAEETSPADEAAAERIAASTMQDEIVAARPAARAIVAPLMSDDCVAGMAADGFSYKIVGYEVVHKDQNVPAWNTMTEIPGHANCRIKLIRQQVATPEGPQGAALESGVGGTAYRQVGFYGEKVAACKETAE